MKKTIIAIIALVAACALCCLPLFIPMLAGASFFGAQLWGKPLSVEAVLCASAPALLAGIAIYAVLRAMKARRSKAGCGNPACAPSGTCGCK